MAWATSGSRQDRSALTRAAAALIWARAWTIGNGMVSPDRGKFCTARAVCAPHSASAGTTTSPMESCSTRLGPLGSLMSPSWLKTTARCPCPWLELAQPDPADAVVLTLGQHEGGPAAGGQHVVDRK